MKRLVVLSLCGCWLLPRGAEAGDAQLVLPSWASDRPHAAPRADKQPTDKQPTNKPEPARKPPPAAPPSEEAPQPVSPPTPTSQPAAPLDEAEATFTALKMFRVNQAAMRLCDRLARRRGQDPPRRVRFQVKIDAAGKAGVAVGSEAPMTPEVARCYQSLAQRWPYPVTGTPYALDVSRISTATR